MSGAPQRTLLLWCPDWPVLAAEIVDGVPATDPVVVLHANRVIACSERARAEGIRRGLRRREAQGRCPHLTVVDHDPGRDVRAFEPVVAAVEEVVAGVEVIRPGACATAARGPSRYLGGEEAAAERIVEHVAQACAVESQAGIADGVFAAGLAAREGRIVDPGGTREFLAARPVEALGRPALADLLRRLGVRTLGEFAALPAGDVLARFGFDGALAHRLADGRDDRPLAVRQPPADLTVTADHDEPIDRVDAAAFAARTLAERLHERLAGYGLACTRLGIEAVTAHGQELHRVWRHDGLLTATAIADRVRWQLDGWLSGSNGRGGTRAARPTAGIVRLRLVPDGVLAQAGLQPGLWGETGAERERAHRALSRVQGILGPEAVVTAVLGGGRSPADQVRLVPWGDERVPARPGPPPSPPAASAPGAASASVVVPAGGGARRRAGRGRAVAEPPWPGRIPPPSPAVVLPTPLPADVRDSAGEPVVVSARLAVSAAPARLTVGVGRPAEITGWAGPWPVDERWWAPAEARRRARFQVSLADGAALLLAVEGGQWLVEAIYD
ncbi:MULTISPECIES: DNA polymerase Y family protein [unclassified Micromonospora]|uniref:DNA polymerase Y family protein n=1 Tax=unclassified Micromonospora TaxID=2617518 RepID=UPI001C244AB3|nr:MULTISPECIES: DNA polymerase Y family protein [unclassified Micromonospora]MBU8856190.1 DNA polymerase Y family protein [Micromonospora sp. WMMB482]MDM4781796.1 DNA polymerase Y family protein [Micromonospora sp. b486]